MKFKKFLALFLALAMMVSLNVTCFAAEASPSNDTVTLMSEEGYGISPLSFDARK